MGLVASAILIALLVAVGIRDDWSANGWEALAAWVTAGVAVVAGIFAVSQLKEARQLRVEAAQPYVAAFMESSEVDRGFVDLVFRNFGATAAVDIEISVEPAPKMASGNEEPEQLWIPSLLPTLVPGQEWRTLWDYARPRTESDLPNKALAKIQFSDAHGRQYGFEYSLDWEPFIMSGGLVTYGAHHSAKSLREIEKSIKKWSEGVGGGLAVTARDGDGKDERHREQRRGQDEEEA